MQHCMGFRYDMFISLTCRFKKVTLLGCRIGINLMGIVHVFVIGYGISRHFCKDIFKYLLLNETFYSYFVWNFTEVCSAGSNRQEVGIGSGNGLAPNRRQAITWNNIPISQIPACTCSISHKAPFGTEICISVLKGALWDMERVHSGIYELGQLWLTSAICPWPCVISRPTWFNASMGINFHRFCNNYRWTASRFVLNNGPCVIHKGTRNQFKERRMNCISGSPPITTRRIAKWGPFH